MESDLMLKNKALENYRAARIRFKRTRKVQRYIYFTLGILTVLALVLFP